MGCNCGKKRMAKYSSTQAARQAAGNETVVAATTPDWSGANNNTSTATAVNGNNQ